MFNKPTSEPVGPEQNKMEPVGPRPKIRPVGLGLHALFSKKPETEPDLRAQARPTSTINTLHTIINCVSIETCYIVLNNVTTLSLSVFNIYV